jgi:hypothetical protein
VSGSATHSGLGGGVAESHGVSQNSKVLVPWVACNDGVLYELQLCAPFCSAKPSPTRTLLGAATGTELGMESATSEVEQRQIKQRLRIHQQTDNKTVCNTV